MVERIMKLWKDEEGATMVEYALLLALVSIVAIGILTTLGGTVTTKYTQADGALAGANP